MPPLPLPGFRAIITFHKEENHMNFSFFHPDRSVLQDHEGVKSILLSINILLTLALVLAAIVGWKSHWQDRGGLLNTVSGDSMNPTLTDGQMLYSEKLTDFSRQDIVYLTVPEKGESFPGVSKGDYFVKRIIGLPGETVSIHSDGAIFVDGDYLWEPYVDPAIQEKTWQGEYEGRITDLTLKEDEYFVLGDNRGNSLDSRAFGPVLTEEIHAAVETSPTRLVIENFSILLLLAAVIPLLFYHVFGFLSETVCCAVLRKKES